MAPTKYTRHSKLCFLKETHFQCASLMSLFGYLKGISNFTLRSKAHQKRQTYFVPSATFFTKSVTLCLHSVSTDKAEVLSFPLPHPNTPSTVLYTQATVSFSAITIISGYCVLEVVSALRMSSCVRDLVPRVVMLTDD